ncbi:MAG: tetratricopeptide repeat protein, partial [Candidatus Rhabdochlamydia sp.]
MGISLNILTEAGLNKISLPVSKSSSCKIRLYFFSDQTPEGLAKIQTIFQLEIKGKIYDGYINEMFRHVQHKPYLLKQGRFFKLISEKEATQLRMSKANDDWGNAYDELGKIRKAIDFHEKTLKIAIEIKSRLEEGRAWSDLGNAYQELGETYKAIDYYKKALTIAVEIKDRLGEGRVWSDLGNAYRELGDTHKAIDSHEKALNIAVEVKNRLGEGRAWSDLGNAYQELGETRKAIDFYEKAL